MIIGIDGNEANIENRVGSNVYAFELLKKMSQLDTQNQFRVYLKQPPVSDLPTSSANLSYRILKPGILFTRFSLPLSLQMDQTKPNVFFSPGHYAPACCPVPLAISVMDLSFLYYPRMFKKRDLYKLKNWTLQAISRADHIFTISRHAKKDIADNYQVAEDKITVTYPGFNQNLYSAPVSRESIIKVSNKYKIKAKYLLYLGTLQPRKNLNRLIRSFASLKNNNLQLVIAGKRGWGYAQIFSEVKKYKLEDQVVFTGFVAEEDKPALIKGAECLLLVSLYEGFGLPVVESMAAGTPVVVSQNSSLAEISEGIGFYVNPESITSIASGINRVLQLNKQQKGEIISKGKKLLNKYSWKETSAKILEVLYEIAI